jgi:hypothetical protein
MKGYRLQHWGEDFEAFFADFESLFILYTMDTKCRVLALQFY